MRMWMVPTALLCKDHLLGEHNELHKLEGHLRRGRALGRYATHRRVDPSRMHARHDELAREMLARGYRHESPLPPVRGPLQRVAISKCFNLGDLLNRCAACAARAPETR